MSVHETETETETSAAGGFRLSPQQRRAWSLQRAFGGRAWTTVGVWTVEGALDAGDLAASLHREVERLEILRTRYRRVHGMSMPLQRIEESLPPRIEERGPAGLPAAEAVDSLLLELSEAELDPAEDAPLRAVLARLDDGRSLLGLAAPALCLDRPGLEALAEALVAAAADRDAAAMEAEEPLQYADIAEWQNALASGEEGEEEREAWRRLDLAAATRIRLPFTLPAAASGARAPFAPRIVTAAAPGATPDVVLAAWRTLLGRLASGAEAPEPVLCAVVDGREYEELHGVVGALAKGVPLALDLDESWPAERLVGESGRASAEARASQEYWDGSHLEAGGGEGEPAYLPFGFEVRTAPPALEWRARGSAEAARLLPAAERSYVEPFALHLVCRLPAPGAEAPAPRLELHYDPDLIEGEDAERTLEQLVALAGAFTAAPRRAVFEADGLAAAEREGVTEPPAVPGPGVVERFVARARAHPERPALACGETSLTYGELDALSARWARRLRAEGVGTETTVAVCVDRSVEMVGAILAVLRAGGAYVPVDPAQPRRRVAAIVEGAGARLAIVGGELRDRFDEATVPVVSVEALAATEDASSELPPPPRPEHLAYVLFTSGSTGEPKGVAVEHRQLAAYVDAARTRLDLDGLAEEAVFATVSTFAADLGNTVVFPALTGGRCLHVVPGDAVSDPEAFAAYAGRNAIDCLKIVPSHLEALLTASAPETVVPRRRLVLGGESLHWELVDRLRALAPSCRLFNHYGPTEATVGAIAGEAPLERPRAASVPLGTPLHGARVDLLAPAGAGRGLRRVPTWAVGEIFLGGSGIARGYLGRPAATAARFVPDPFAGEERAGARLYRTGDLARRLPGSTFEFLGRADSQVKIRGFRVEPGEIESHLRRHPAVREVVVAARGEDGGEPRLVAYVVPADADAPDDAAAPALRAFLADRLPEAMVPSAFVALKALPLTSNGKIDRAALPAPDAVRPDLAATFVPPGTEAERAVAAIWQDVLRLDRVGLHDNFFDLGGHSLLLVQVSARLRERFGCDITMVELFRRTTVAAIVEHLAAGAPGPEGADAEAGDEERRERAASRQESLQRQRETRRRRRSAAAG